jgi:hypothetical protein
MRTLSLKESRYPCTIASAIGAVLEFHCKMGRMKLPSGQLTPARIQDFVNSLRFNFEKRRETHRSVEEAIKHGEAHCFEGALIAAALLMRLGHKPLLLDLKAARPDFDHVVAVFKEGGRWGAISKTNHAILRYREPVYASLRELAMSYFNEYFLEDGTKTMRSFSAKPFSLSRYGDAWLKGSENLAWLAHELDAAPHVEIMSPAQAKRLRKAEPIERQTLRFREYLR